MPDSSDTAEVSRPRRAPARKVEREETRVFVVWFDDIKGSTALKEQLKDEAAFQRLRKEHDDLLHEVIERDGAGEIIKSTGDGLLAVFHKPSTAVERSMEIQERMHGHHLLSVRIGMDMGEVRVEYDGDRIKDIFGRHVDWAARTAGLADGGHICVTKAVHTDASTWIMRHRVAWKEHGLYRVKAGELPLEIFEPHNANVGEPMAKLHGDQVAPPGGAAASASAAPAPHAVKAEPHGGALRLIKPWEAVARDGRDFAEKGAGMMYWFKVPLGGVCYPEGFRNFLQPALENPRIRKIRFVLDSAVEAKRKIWSEMVLPQIREWAAKGGFAAEETVEEHLGRIHVRNDPATMVSWLFEDLSAEYTPSFKFFVADPDNDDTTSSEAQIFLSTATRKVRFADGAQHTVRVPDAIIRVHEDEDRAMLHALNLVANQWDSLFT